MKKISLKDVKNGLKRDEMRSISGGSGSGDCWNAPDPLCCACKRQFWDWYCTAVGYCH